jgi:hypothetical protein
MVTDSIVPGRVIAIKGTLDKRDDGVRATAQKVKLLTPDQPGPTRPENSDEPAIVLRFSSMATADELRKVKEVLAESPGARRVQLLFERTQGEPLRVDVSNEFRIDLTPQLEARLAPWLVPNYESVPDAMAALVAAS